MKGAKISAGGARVFRLRPVLLGAALLALAGCDNMQHQRGANEVDAPPGVARARTRPTPAFTVARGEKFPGDPTLTGFRDGQELARSPLPLTRELLELGRARFAVHCSPCHGDDGYGRGIIVRRGFPAPPSYHEDRLRTASDGHLFDVITRGYGTMLPFADHLDPHERWAVVAYIRALQRSQHSAFAALPAEDRQHFPAP